MSKPESSLDPLLAYTHNLTAHAKTGLLSRHPEYSGEAARVTEILARRHDSSGEWARYPFDMAPLLKRLLSRREIQLWGACTLAEYRGTIERDAAMQRHFHEEGLPSARALLGKG